MLLADRGYDADWIRAFAAAKGASANIPSKSNRNDPICFGPYLPHPQPGRTPLQQGQTLPPGRNALRQARRQLPCIRPTCVNQAVAPR
jgi:transposase